MERSQTREKRLRRLLRQNAKWARRLVPGIDTGSLNQVRDLTLTFGFSISGGDLLRLNGGWYVTHAGLLRLASRRRCAGVQIEQVDQFSDHLSARWVFKATVFKTATSKGFVGYGDADPSNVSSIVHGAEMRVAETRAVNRALRKAYGIGLCSVDELGALSSPSRLSSTSPPSNGSGAHDSHCPGKAQPRLRDQLCLLIRHFQLDPNLVKSYAADFCGTESLSDASRQSVEAFVSHLATAAKENRDALVCKLNSYTHPVEARS